MRTRRTRGGRPSAPRVSRENVQAVRHAFESSLRGDQAPSFIDAGDRVWTLRDGGAVRVEYYGSGEGALEAVGLG